MAPTMIQVDFTLCGTDLLVTLPVTARVSGGCVGGACTVLAACSMLTICGFMVMFPWVVAKIVCVLQTSASSPTGGSSPHAAADAPPLICDQNEQVTLAVTSSSSPAAACHSSTARRRRSRWAPLAGCGTTCGAAGRAATCCPCREVQTAAAAPPLWVACARWVAGVV
jgi:hypothetical protein